MSAVALAHGSRLVIDHLEGSDVHSRGVCLSVESRQSSMVEVCAVIPAERLGAVIDALRLHQAQLQAVPA